MERKQTSMTSSIEMSKFWSVVLLSKRYRLLYCPIGKVANTSIRKWLMNLEGIKQGYDESKDNVYNSSLALKLSLEKTYTLKVLADNYYSFAFVRNPFSRLVSSYLNKFIDQKPIPLAAAERMNKIVNSRKFNKSQMYIQKLFKGSKRLKEPITFREFVKYLSETNIDEMDNHWAPQYLFLQTWQFDFIGKFEKLEKDFDTLLLNLNQREGIEPIKDILEISNKSDYKSSTNECFADIPGERIRAFNSYPSYRFFYDQEIERIVANIYSEDFKLFGYKSKIK